MRQNGTHSRLFSLVYEQAQRSDISRGIYISVFREAARALKRFAIARTESGARGTSLRSVTRVNQHDRHTREFCLIFQKGSQLKERPTTDASAKDAAFLYAAQPYAFQIFQGNPFAFALGLLNNSLSYRMVYDARSRSLFPRKPFQGPTRPACAFGLKRTSYALTLDSILFDFLSRHFFACRKRGDMEQPKIHTKKLFYIFDVLFGYLGCLKKKEFSLPGNQVCLAFNERQPVGTVTDKRDFQTSIDGPQGDSILGVRKNPLIIGDCSQRLKNSFAFAIKLVGIGHFRNAADHDLSGKTRVLDLPIRRPMQFELIEDFLFPGNLGNPIASAVSSAHGSKQRGSLFTIWQKLYLKGQFHGFRIARMFEEVKKGRRFLSTDESGSFQRRGFR